ncbi:enoyl-CoA hydratase/isomerase family protein [Dialister sp.]|uniref:enoyl-CoA hydratase/isomerase family protein n=1 Tax=Dialister sp. TaxID=1955814 RepID=UPI0025DD40F1|nr:enoyl-CoA hydratase-related protein [Dialister sp.]
MDYTRIHTDIAKGIETITLDYGPTLNALDMTMAQELADALEAAEADRAVKVIVLTGAGRAFSAGGDIRYMKAHCDEPDFSKKSMAPLAGKLSEIVLYMKKMSKIIICAVAGAAAGGAANLAFACDFIYAADNAKFLQAFVGIGLCPDTGGVYFLPRMVGSHRAFDMFVTGRPVSAKEALEIGLVKEVTTKEELMPKVMAFAEKLTEGPLLAYGNMKKLMFASLYKGFEDYMKDEAVYLAQCSGSEDFKEGITAFLEKRKAEFKGK